MWGLLAGAIGYVLSGNPADRKPDLFGGCGWYTVFGTNGPTCGGTRMVWYLLHGDVVNAARMHLVALIGTPFVLYMLVQWSAMSLFGLRLPALRLRWWVWAAYGVAFVVTASRKPCNAARRLAFGDRATSLPPTTVHVRLSHQYPTVHAHR